MRTADLNPVGWVEALGAGALAGLVVLAAGALWLWRSRAAGRARVVSGDDLTAFTGGAAPVTDATARSAPRPPPDLFRR